MARGALSQADSALIGALRDRGVRVSGPQLERWRTAGILPRNERHGLGRGRGAISSVPSGVIDLAHGLALATQRGRPLHEAVLRLFTYNPRYRLTIFLAAPQLPLAESPVRDALIWFIQNRENSVTRRIQRVIASTESPDAVEETAGDLALKHYLGVYRSQYRDHTGNFVTRGPRLTKEQAIAQSNLAIADVLGGDAIGADLYADGVRYSTIISDSSRAELEQLIQFMIAENTRRELAGAPLIGSHPPETMEHAISAVRCIEFSSLCRIRDTLALLAEANLIYESAREKRYDDPKMQRLLQFFTSSMEAHFLTCAANLIARAPIAEAWKVMAQIVIMYCPEQEFATLDKLYSKINFTVEDIRSIVSRRVSSTVASESAARSESGEGIASSAALGLCMDLCRRFCFMAGAFRVIHAVRGAQQGGENCYRGGVFYPLWQALP